MPRHGRRGKLPKGEKLPKKEGGDNTPSKLLSSMLKTLDLTFERDIGMLNGKSVRSIPNKKTLLELQSQLDSLNEILGTIARGDQETIEALRKIRDSKNEKQANDEKQETSNADGQHESSTATEETNIIDKGVQSPPKPPPSNEISGTIENDVESIKQAADNMAKEEINEDKDLQVHRDQPREKRPFDSETENRATENENTQRPDNKKQKIDVDKMENDPTVKNPKSEFVVSQTLPRAAAALGLFNEEGLESTGEDFLKKKNTM